MVVATGAVRCDGVTDRLVPPEYPAVRFLPTAEPADIWLIYPDRKP